MDRSNPWDAPPKTASWRRLVTVVVPLVATTACDIVGSDVAPGTSSPTHDSGSTVGTEPPDTSDTGAD